MSADEAESALDIALAGSAGTGRSSILARFLDGALQRSSGATAAAVKLVRINQADLVRRRSPENSTQRQTQNNN